jgi:uncharacterized membrane protein
VVPILLEPLIASFCKAYAEVEIAASEELVDLAADMVTVRLTPPLRVLTICANTQPRV